MSITPPDPGLAMQLAKSSSYDRKNGGFVQTRTITGEAEIRYLRPDGGKWVASYLPERRISPETFTILQDGEPSDRVPNGIKVNGETYQLVDDGFEAVADPT